MLAVLEAASPHHWSTISNESAFGTDYFTRTAVVKSNIAADGSLTICVQADAPSNPAQRTNWLPAPKGDVSPCVRAYWPKEAVTDGSWTPPPVKEQRS